MNDTTVRLFMYVQVVEKGKGFKTLIRSVQSLDRPTSLPPTRRSRSKFAEAEDSRIKKKKKKGVRDIESADPII